VSPKPEPATPAPRRTRWRCPVRNRPDHPRRFRKLAMRGYSPVGASIAKNFVPAFACHLIRHHLTPLPRGHLRPPPALGPRFQHLGVVCIPRSGKNPVIVHRSPYILTVTWALAPKDRVDELQPRKPSVRQAVAIRAKTAKVNSHQADPGQFTLTPPSARRARGSARRSIHSKRQGRLSRKNWFGQGMAPIWDPIARNLAVSGAIRVSEELVSRICEAGI